MKKIGLVLIMMISAVAFQATAADHHGKKHECSKECTKEGKCVKACGEKGHECSEACKKAAEAHEGHNHADHGHGHNKVKHECTEACKTEGKCVYKHGEEGHTYSKACHDHKDE